MINFKKEIAGKIAEVTGLDKEELVKYVEVPPESKLGDYAFPCFKLAKELRKAPPVIANEIKGKIDIETESKSSSGQLKIIQKLSVEGGYLNIFINKELLAETVLEEIDNKKEKYGHSEDDISNQSKNVIVEYSSPNIAKPMHIGHLRNTVIGRGIT